MAVGRYNWWPAAVVIGSLLLILVLLAVWWVSAGSDRIAEREQVEIDTGQPPPQEPAQEQQPVTPAEEQAAERREPVRVQERTVIRDSREVREVVRGRPVYVYIERPEGEQQDQPAAVIVVPQGNEEAYSGQNYQRTEIPAQITFDNRQYYLEPGSPERRDPNTMRQTNRTVAGYRIYTERDEEAPPDTLYLRLQPDRDLFIPYEEVSDNRQTNR